MPSAAHVATPFKGREAETGRLLDALADLKRGQGALFLVAGEPGIGKTRLAEEVVRRAREQGGLVAWGAAWDGGGAPAYWPWMEVLRELKGALPEPGPALRRDLGPLIGEAPADDGEDPEALHFRRSDALRSALASAASRAPLVIVLDDLHAADLATLRSLHFVARALRSLPVLIVGTHRDGEARLRPEVATLLAKIAREGETLSLEKLRREAVAELMHGLEPLAPGLVDRVYEASGGNPFFVHEMVRLVRSGAPADRIPDGVRALVTERLLALDAEGRGALQMVAVLGRETSLGVLSRLAGRSRHELHALLEPARLAGVVELDGPDRLAFVHSLFRECLYEGMDPSERAKLHLRAGQALSSGGSAGFAIEESVARHLLLALPEGDAVAAVETARAAAGTCRRALAFDRAVELLERAVLALADVAHMEALQADVEIDLAEVLVCVGQCEKSRELCAGIAERARMCGDAIRFSRAALAHGAEIRLGVSDPVLVALLEEAERLLGNREPALRARVMARLAATRLVMDGAEPIALARAAIDLARSTGDDDALLQALHMGGAALVCYAPPAQRRDVAAEFARLALVRHELVLAQRGYQRLLIDAMELGERAELEDACRVEEQLGRMLGHPRFRWKGALIRSMVAVIDGRWSDSREAVEDAVRLVAEADDPAGRAALAIHRIGVFRARVSRSLAEVEGFADDPVMRAIPGNDIMGPLLAACILARAGDKERGRAEFRKALPLRPMVFAITSALTAAADAAFRLDDRTTAEQILPALRALPLPAVSWGATGFIWVGFLSELCGGLLSTLGQLDAAVEELERAVEAADLFGARPAAAESRITLAAVLAARAGHGDRARSEALLEHAESVARDLDMDGSLARIGDVRVTLAAAAGGRVSTTPELTFELAREGEVWAVTFGGKLTRLKHSRALEILKTIVDHPGREFHVLDFGAEVEPGAALDTGDAGELIDRNAKAAYEKRIVELGRELEEAERWNDAGRRARLQAELEFLEDELGRSVGSGGRLRRAGGAGERARVNVHKRLRGVIERLSGELPELASHLKLSVKTGLFVSYQPNQGARHAQ